MATATRDIDVERQAYTVDETAHALHIGRVMVYKLIAEKRIRIVKIGSRTVVPRTEIARLLSENR